MTPYGRDLLNYVIANSPVLRSKHGQRLTNEQLFTVREQWAVNYLNRSIGCGWQNRDCAPDVDSLLVSVEELSED